MLRDFVSLISVVPGAPEKQQGIDDKRACQLFKYLWEKRYPLQPVQIVFNSSEEGNRPEIEIHQSFIDRWNDIHVEEAGIRKFVYYLIEYWNADVRLHELYEYDNNIGKNLGKKWQEIQIGANLLTCEKPFRMEY